jgi:hypothetical protein
MLIARTTFVDPFDGEIIREGVTRVDEYSDVARKFPARFAPSPSRRGWGTTISDRDAVRGTRSAEATETSNNQVVSREVPELRSTTSPVEVVICRSARQAILDDLFWSTRQDAKESGGFLFSRPMRSWDKGPVEILHATRSGDARRFSDSVLLDVEQWRSAELAFAIDGYEQPLCGLWHSHPSTRDRTPSTSDLTAWLGVLRWNERHGRGAPYSIGLTYAASEYLGDSWTRPYTSCWVVRREGHGKWAEPVCEPAKLTERR